MCDAQRTTKHIRLYWQQTVEPYATRFIARCEADSFERINTWLTAIMEREDEKRQDGWDIMLVDDGHTYTVDVRAYTKRKS